MTSNDLVVVRRPKRRTHLMLHGASGLMCNTRTALSGAELTPVPLAGGATARLKNDLMRELDGNACIPCTLIALGMIALYASRDTGRAW
jgi:hypothetical protein